MAKMVDSRPQDISLVSKNIKSNHEEIRKLKEQNKYNETPNCRHRDKVWYKSN